MKRGSDLRNPKVSVVIPAYRAERIIKNSLINVHDTLMRSRFNFEIICVVDGRVDKTESIAKRVASKYPHIKVLSYEKNLGKGHAVRYGMANASGDIIGFIDAGYEISPNSIGMLLEHFEWYKADIIIGSKRHPASRVIYPWQRKIISWGYQMLVRILFGLNIRDTQVGLKFFRRDVLKAVMPRLLVKAFAFDIEILSVANYLGFKRIFEAPIELKMKFGKGISTIASAGFLRTAMAMAWDTLAVFYRLKVVKYYDNKNKSSWITPPYLRI